jgi:hypothetical protein
MAVTSKSVQPDAATADNGPIVAEQPKPGDGPAAAKDWDGVTCVVPDADPTPHMGRAVPGSRVCSAHAMRYKADGTPRG